MIYSIGLNSNPRYGHCRNAYNAAFHTGGSSSGSGSAVVSVFFIIWILFYVLHLLII